MNISALLAQFETWRKAGNPLVLATVVGTAGSTYAKAGTHMLINGDLGYEGLLSGGCLEGDLAERARPVLEDGQARLVVYDMRDQEQDRLWGLGLGCNGMMEILLQRMDATNDYQPMSSLADRIAQRNVGVYALQVTGKKPGAWLVGDNTGRVGTITDSAATALLDEPMIEEPMRKNHEDASYLVAPIPSIIRLLLLGTGPDAVPLVRLSQELGWEVTAVDHRPGYVERFVASAGIEPRHGDPTRLSDTVDLERYDAAVVMSHHLATDLEYLRNLATTQIPYVGALGPSARRDTLLTDLGSVSKHLRSRLYAPVGLDIGARGPEPIALSIIAQIQGVLHSARCEHFYVPETG